MVSVTDNLAAGFGGIMAADTVVRFYNGISTMSVLVAFVVAIRVSYNLFAKFCSKDTCQWCLYCIRT